MNKRGKHPGVSLWRDRHDPTHWVVALFRRWYFHVYTRAEYREQRKFYWLRRDLWDGLNEAWLEFRRVFPPRTGNGQ